MSNSGIPQINLNNMMLQLRQILTPGQESEIGLPAGAVLANQPGVVTANLNMEQSKLVMAALLQDEALGISPGSLPLFFKELMRLPQDIRLLLLMLTFDSPSDKLKQAIEKNLLQLIQEDGASLVIPLQDIQSLLGKNALQASDKLMKMLMSNQMGQTRGGQQVAELSTLLNKLSEQVQASPVKALENLILLYLPWYPLILQQKLVLNFEFEEGGEGGGTQEISVVIYLETNTLGRFKIMIQELNPLQLVAQVSHEHQAAHILPQIEGHLNAFLAQEGLPKAIWNTEILEPQPLLTAQEKGQSTQIEDDEAEALSSGTSQAKGSAYPKEQKQITILPGANISLLVISAAYRIARFIFEMDESNRHLTKTSS